MASKLIYSICLDVTLGVEMLLEAGADQTIKDYNKKTAIDHAVAKSNGSFKTINRMLSLKTNSISGYWEIAELLLNA